MPFVSGFLYLIYVLGPRERGYTILDLDVRQIKFGQFFKE